MPNRARIEITFTEGIGLPEVKFFGEIKINDVRNARLALQRGFRQYIYAANSRQRKERIAKEQEKKEVIANKEQKDESKTIGSVESRPGNTSSSNGAKGTGQRSSSSVQSSRSGRDV